MNKETHIKWMSKCKEIVEYLMDKENRKSLKDDKDLIDLIESKFNDEDYKLTACQFILKLTCEYVDLLEKKTDKNIMYG